MLTDDALKGDEAADEKLAEDWDDMTQSDGAEEETDSLFASDSNTVTGIDAIINSASVNYERLPMLEVVFDRLVRMMSTSLRNFTSDNVEVSLEKTVSVRFGDYLDSMPLPAMINVVKAEEWDNYALLTVDSALIYSVVDVLLGGRRGKSAMPEEGRAYTTIERKLVELMAHVISSDLNAAFYPVSPVKFRFERLETNPRFTSIARPANAAILAQFRIEMDDRGGMIELLIPNATMEPVRELLLQMFLGEKFGRDTIWENHLGREIWETNVDVRAELGSKTVLLRDVLDLKVGSHIDLDITTDSMVSMTCGDIPVLEGRMGQKSGNIYVKVHDIKLKEH